MPLLVVVLVSCDSTRDDLWSRIRKTENRFVLLENEQDRQSSIQEANICLWDFAEIATDGQRDSVMSTQDETTFHANNAEELEREVDDGGLTGFGSEVEKVRKRYVSDTSVASSGAVMSGGSRSVKDRLAPWLKNCSGGVAVMLYDMSSLRPQSLAERIKFTVKSQYFFEL